MVTNRTIAPYYTLLILILLMGARSAAFAHIPCVAAADGTPVADSLHSDSAVVDSAALTGAAEPKKKRNFFVRLLRAFDDTDPDYIVPNYYNYTVMAQNTNFFQLYRIKASDAQGNSQTLEMAPEPSFKVGPYFGWRWLFLGYTFDVANHGGVAKSQEMSLSLYSSMIGVDLVYVKNDGQFTIRRARGFGDDVARAVEGSKFSGIDSYTSSVNVYYVFNHRRFSYPAAYAQSTVQRRSQGSWVLGLCYSHNRMEMDYRRLPSALITPIDNEGHTPLIDEMKVERTDYKSYTISGGYAYNWVFAPKWLFSISATPAFGLRHSKGERMNTDDLWVSMKRFNFDFIGRVGLVWNNSKYFAGLSAVTHIYDYKKEGYSLSNMVNYVNIYVGFMFARKSQYRHR